MTKNLLLRLARTTARGSDTSASGKDAGQEAGGGKVGAPRPGFTTSALGITQIFGFGSTYYLPAVLAKPIAGDTGWPLAWIVGGVSVGLLCAGLVSPRRGADPAPWRPPGAERESVILALGLAILAIAPSLPCSCSAGSSSAWAWERL